MSRIASLLVAPAVLGIAGCGAVHNPWCETGPAVTRDWASPTEADVRANFSPAAARTRNLAATSVDPVDGVVVHGPLYFEDPFVDKGSGNGPFDERGTGRNEYRVGWEDYLALPYGLARHHLNWIAAPVSMAVTPPWTAMASDGFLSRQALGYDHDATRAVCE